MPVYIHCSIRICSVFDHYGYGAPEITSWKHLMWYSEDRTLQWLESLRAELNPHEVHGHEFCHRDADQSTLAITRAIMDRASAAVTTRVTATGTTSSAPGSSDYSNFIRVWLPLGKTFHQRNPSGSLPQTVRMNLMVVSKS